MNPVEEEVILVDPRDGAIGTAPKTAAHRIGLRHRAFSVVLVDDAGRVLLQRRARAKYHSGGLWANSCCGHPRPGEDTHDAAVRRAVEELGVAATLTKAGVFNYLAAVGDTLIEHEVDHVFVGTALGEIAPDAREVEETAWLYLEDVAIDLHRNPARYAAWLIGVLRVAAPRIAAVRLREVTPAFP